MILMLLLLFALDAEELRFELVTVMPLACEFFLFFAAIVLRYWTSRRSWITEREGQQHHSRKPPPQSP